MEHDPGLARATIYSMSQEKINLNDYPGGREFAERMIEKARREGKDSIYTTDYFGPDPKDVDYIRHGRKSWIDWWRDRLGITY